MNKIFRKHEFYIAVIIVVLSIVIGLLNNAFFSRANMFNLMKSCVVMGIMALGAMLVLISGGIDISFTAISVFAMYVTTKILTSYNYSGTILLAFIMSAIIGGGLGLINAFFISKYKLPPLIVSLGTMNAYRGFLLGFIGKSWINQLPPSMLDFSKNYFFKSVTESGKTVGFHFSIFILLAIILIVWFLMRKTTLGRSIYAMGGNRAAAERAGFKIPRIQIFIYSFVGLLAGIAGIIHCSNIRAANPFDIVGTEMNVIAAVVLGGTSLSGGRGTVIGTILGVVLITMVNNSLIILGIPSYWQKLVTGFIIVIATGVTAFRETREKKRILRA